jgi:hypothetical protein
LGRAGKVANFIFLCGNSKKLLRRVLKGYGGGGQWKGPPALLPMEQREIIKFELVSIECIPAKR